MALPTLYKDDTPWKKAQKTGIWAKIMAKWRITYLTKGSKKWRFVSFEGKTGVEPRGIVDFIAIRKHLNGDYFDLILFQVKGGTARKPTDKDKERLREIHNYYHANWTILATWKKGVQLTFEYLDENCKLHPLDEPSKIFK